MGAKSGQPLWKTEPIDSMEVDDGNFGTAPVGGILWEVFGEDGVSEDKPFAPASFGMLLSGRNVEQLISQPDPSH